MENYSLADIKAATEGNEGGFGGGAWWIIILFLFLFGTGGFGGGRQNDAVSQEILSNQHFDALGARITNLANGICDSTYALNNTILTEGRALQTQIADCCCSTQLLGKDIMAGIHAEAEATRALIQQNEVQALRDKVSDLQLQQSQCAQNEYLVGKLAAPVPVPAYQVPNPFCNYNPCGCGCNGMTI